MNAPERRQARRSLVDYSSRVPMWCSDADTDELIDANDAALRFWRYERQQFIGMQATQLLSPDELPKQRTLAKRNLWGETGPWKCRRGDGSFVYATVRWQRVMQADRVCDFVFVAAGGESLASIEQIVDPDEPRPNAKA